MINLVFILIFIFCFAIGIASILISHQFISTYNTDFHKNYFYYLVSFYAFALYAIWGHILIRIVLEGLNSRPEVVETVSNFSSILGLPFLFLSWIMLLNMAHSLYDMKVKRWWIGYHVGMFILLILGVWIGYDVLPDSDFLEEKSVRYIQISYISIFGLINYSVFLALVRIFNGKKR